MPELFSPRRGGGTLGLRAGSRREGEKDSPRPRHFLRVNLEQWPSYDRLSHLLARPLTHSLKRTTKCGKLANHWAVHRILPAFNNGALTGNHRFF